MATGGGGFRVELPVLQQNAQYVLALVPQMRSQLQQLKGEMETLFGTWQGMASQSFQRLHDAWQQDYVQLNQALDGIGQELQQNHQTYVQTDEASRAPGY